MIESLFSIVQMLLMIFYGRAADRLGRKPVLVWSLTGVGLSMAFFGMGQSLTQMVVTRCIAGAFGGSVVTIRTMISENCNKSNQARAFSWYMFVRNVGIFVGPLIGMFYLYLLHSICDVLCVERSWTDTTRKADPSQTRPNNSRACSKAYTSGRSIRTHFQPTSPAPSSSPQP